MLELKVLPGSAHVRNVRNILMALLLTAGMGICSLHGSTVRIREGLCSVPADI